MHKPIETTRLGLIVALLLCLASSSSFAVGWGEREREVNIPEPAPWVEEVVDVKRIPALNTQNLIAFQPAASTTLRWGIDPTSVQIGAKDQVVRYVVVAVSESGHTSAMFEGIHCGRVEHKIYARQSVGASAADVKSTAESNNSTWSVLPNAEWKPLHNSTPSRHAIALARLGFCEGVTAPSSVKDALNHLKAGGRSN